MPDAPRAGARAYRRIRLLCLWYYIGKGRLDLEWLSLLIIHQSTANILSVHGPQENVLTFTSQLKLSPTLTLGCSGNAVHVERARAPVTPWVRLHLSPGRSTTTLYLVAATDTLDLAVPLLRCPLSFLPS